MKFLDQDFYDTEKDLSLITLSNGLPLSQLICDGAKKYPQSYTKTFEMDWWNQELKAVSVWGAALIELRFLERLRTLTCLNAIAFLAIRGSWPEVFQTELIHCDCGRGFWSKGFLISHLNDDHRMMREEIAAWIKEAA